jgi:hypothetical protein
MPFCTKDFEADREIDMFTYTGMETFIGLDNTH